MKSFFEKLSTGYCIVCNKGHSLIDGICFDCRVKNSRQRTNEEAKAINKFVRTKSKTIHSKQI